MVDIPLVQHKRKLLAKALDVLLELDDPARGASYRMVRQPYERFVVVVMFREVVCVRYTVDRHCGRSATVRSPFNDAAE